jgi:hypothetical protein
MGVPVVKPEEVTGVAFIFSYLFYTLKFLNICYVYSVSVWSKGRANFFGTQQKKHAVFW